MRDFFDTSLLIAAFARAHPGHEASERLFLRAERSKSSCAAHTLVETYSVLTRLPASPRITPAQALLFLQDVRLRITAVGLDEPQHHDLLARLAEQGIGGGRVHDALILECASKAKAETIYTWDTKDFRQLRPDLADKIRTP